MGVVRSTQLLAEVIYLPDNPLSHVTQVVVEAIYPSISHSPATPTGAGVTKSVLEAIYSGSANTLTTQLVVEAIYLDTTTAGGVETGPQRGTRTFGSAT